MKRICLVVLTSLLLTLCACGGGNQPSTPSPADPLSAQVTSADPTPAPEAPSEAVDTVAPSSEAPAPSESDAPSEEPSQSADPTPEAPSEAPSESVEPATSSPEATPEPTPEASSAPTGGRDEAAACIGKSVADLIDAVGQPLSTSYVSSCLGDGEDGEWVYDTFTVYTYREGDVETVMDVG